jgi:hypothetical protein
MYYLEHIIHTLISCVCDCFYPIHLFIHTTEMPQLKKSKTYCNTTDLKMLLDFVRLHLKCDGTCAETRFCLSVKQMSPFKSVGASVKSTTGSRGVRISVSNAGYTMFRGSVRVLATHSIRQFPLHFPSHASPCAVTFQLDSTRIHSDVHFTYHIYLNARRGVFPLHLVLKYVKSS